MIESTSAQSDYKAIFTKLHSSLIEAGTPLLTEKMLGKALADFRDRETRKFSDDEYFKRIVSVAFYSGFKADTVTKRLPTILKHLGDYRQTALYGDSDIQRILSDPGMIRNRRKIVASVENAKKFRTLVKQRGSFQNFLDQAHPDAKKLSTNLEPLKNLRDDLAVRGDDGDKFDYLGGITTFHFMMEFGMPVLKPDRVIVRMFDRLGLIRSRPVANPPNECQKWEAIDAGREFARQTGYPIRYVDLVFVLFGQMKSDEYGIGKGICLTDQPQCAKCGIRAYCDFQERTHG